MNGKVINKQNIDSYRKSHFFNETLSWDIKRWKCSNFLDSVESNSSENTRKRQFNQNGDG